MSSEMDIVEILSLLPHRYPFLLIDRVVSIEPDKSIQAYKNISFNEPFFQGHFPGHPVMPGVLIIEAIAQAGAVLAYKSKGEDMAGKITYVMGLDKVKFRQPVRPGDRLDLEVEIVRPGSRYWKLQGIAKVNGKKVAEAEMTAATNVA